MWNQLAMTELTFLEVSLPQTMVFLLLRSLLLSKMYEQTFAKHSGRLAWISAVLYNRHTVRQRHLRGNSEMNYHTPTHPIHITRQVCCGRETSKTRRMGGPGTGVKNTTPDYV